MKYMMFVVADPSVEAEPNGGQQPDDGPTIYEWLDEGEGAGKPANQASREGHLVDALAPRGDEGRGTLRQASGSREQALIRGSPNGATHHPA